MAETEASELVSPQVERAAVRRAMDRAMAARWDLNTAIFLFAILILIIILVTYTKVGLEVVSPVAIFGLAMVWLVGWRRGKQLYQRFYDEEVAKLEQEFQKTLKGTVKEALKETVEETIEEKVQKALRERWK